LGVAGEAQRAHATTKKEFREHDASLSGTPPLSLLSLGMFTKLSDLRRSAVGVRVSTG
jgi:hypothetical protein